ncbi:MAG: hypothetical protein NTY66_02545 [Candidatus Vogelbacteria bacterium]|nr:hypothetical protein [Candidatus Vogelbacteria bacterium]
MRYFTKDPAVRAASIADREFESVWSQTGSWDQAYNAWKKTYEQTLREFAQGLFLFPETLVLELGSYF